MMKNIFFLKRILISGIVIFSLMSCVQNSSGKKQVQGKRLVAIGTYTEDLGWVVGKAEGIYIYEMDLKTGALRDVATSPGTVNPSYVCIHPDKNILYAVNETGGKEDMPTGLVSAFRIDKNTGSMELINSVSSEGISPCHLSIDVEGEYVFVANYVTGTIAMLPIAEDGSLGEATSVIRHTADDPDKNPHAHMVLPLDNGTILYGIDLGIDQIISYRIDRSHHKLVKIGSVNAAEGAGPRQMVIHPVNKEKAYVINELNGTIDAFDLDDVTGKLTRFQTISTLKEKLSDIAGSADIRITPSGKFLYASNRMEYNDLAIFSIDPETGKLSLVGHKSTGGKTPRNFLIDPEGKFLVVANQDSGNIVVFRINPETGELSETGIDVEVPTPTCVKFL